MKICLAATMGEDQPRPGIGVAHSMLDVADHLSGRLELLADGLEKGPRKPGHSGSPAKAQAARDSEVMTLLMVLCWTILAGKRLDFEA